MVVRQRSAWMFARLSAALSLGIAAHGCSGSVDGVIATPMCTDCPPGQNASGQGSTAANAATPATDTSPGGVGDPRTPDGVGYATRIPKLTNAQWEQSTQALLRLAAPSGAAEQFTQEARDKGYDTMAAATLTVSGDAWARYQTAAETLAAQVAGDAAQLAKITPSGTFANDNAKADAFISQFGRRAFRRPLSAEEKSAYLALYAQGPSLASGTPFEAGARLVIEAMLQSPHFLYRVESATNEKNPKDPRAFLSGYEVATRLSFALLGTTPSDALLDAAQNKELDTADGVAKWAAKLLDTASARDILLSFHEQTFSVADFGTQDKDPALNFNASALEATLKDEARRFLGFVTDQGGGIDLLLTSNVAFVNASSAPFYGLSGVSGAALQQRDLDARTRAGLLTQLGFLTKNATRNTSDPVHRGLGVLRKVLCDEPDPPPQMFSLPEPLPNLTTRQVYEKATACGVGCHDTLINPPGFAFENFDAVGVFRTTEQGKPIDATGTLTLRDGYTPEEKRDGKKTQITFNGAVDLMNQLADQPRVHECYARNFMRYALARELSSVERGASSLLAETSRKQGSLREVVIALVRLDAFRARVSDPE